MALRGPAAPLPRCSTLRHSFVLLFFRSVARFSRRRFFSERFVSHRISGCDYFVVQTRNGYDLLEWFGGHDSWDGLNPIIELPRHALYGEKESLQEHHNA
jgi:hypothetical protein